MFSSRYHCSIALASSTGKVEDSKRDRDCALLEQATWEMISDELYRFHYPSKSEDRDKVQQSIIAGFERTLRDEVTTARAELSTFDRSSRHFDLDEFESRKHRHRRTIAGYHQLITLLKQGDEAFKTAMMDGIMIFEGHRCAVSF